MPLNPQKRCLQAQANQSISRKTSSHLIKNHKSKNTIITREITQSQTIFLEEWINKFEKY